MAQKNRRLRNGLEKEIAHQVHALPEVEQRRVLEFARALAQSTPRGVPGKDLIRFAGSIPRDELRRMSEAIETACERIDAEGW